VGAIVLIWHGFVVLMDARQRSKDLLSVEVTAQRATIEADGEVLREALEALEIFEQCLAEKKVIKEGVLLSLYFSYALNT
jgi:hypothetical protein